MLSIVSPGTSAAVACRALAARGANLVAAARSGRLLFVVDRPTLEHACQLGLGRWPLAELRVESPLRVVPGAAAAEAARLLAGSATLLIDGGSGRPVGRVRRTSLSRLVAASPAGELRLRRTLPAATLALLRELGGHAAACRVRAWLVGGSVRDVLLGRSVLDLDVLVERDACAVAAALVASRGGRLVQHPAFSTARVELPGGTVVDLAAARRESYAKAAELPRVEPGSWLEDAYRRDFTVNAILLRIDPAGFGTIDDPCAGRQDLRRRRLCVLHGLSFVDDPTRGFRAVRLAARLRFALGPHT
ncbi:MAG TPA: hypothetical protein VJS92_16660, partial [Candidatus Polarisedimenticolaceae bacterium]|nr:hypothetical protein [Candidatus Polarisedimenticolaceae bacterium]